MITSINNILCFRSLHSILFLLILLGIKSKGSDKTDLCLLRDSLECTPSYDLQSAYKYINKGIELSKAKDEPKLLAYFYESKGNLLGYANPDMALAYYYKALKIYEGMDYKRGIGSCFHNIALLLDPDQKLPYLRKALSLFSEIKDSTKVGSVYNSLASYYKTICLDSSLIYYEKFWSTCTRTGFTPGLAVYNINMGGYYAFTKEYKTALEYLYRARPLLPENNEYSAERETLMMQIYFVLRMQDSALHYYDLLKEKFNARPDLEHNTYDFLGRYYAALEDFPKAYLFSRKADSINEILTSRNNKNKLELLEMEYDSQLQEEKVMKLNAEIQRSNAIRAAMSILIITILLVSSILMRHHKQRSRKKRELLLAERELIQSKLENTKLRQKYLKDELEYTHNEFSTFANSFRQYHNSWNKVRERVSEILKINDLQKSKGELNDLNLMLTSIFEENEQRNRFLQKSQKWSHSIEFYLKNNYPTLSDMEVNLLILVFLKLSSKEIAVLYNVEPQSVKKKRQRIRKKLGLPITESFDDFFEKVLAEGIEARDHRVVRQTQ